MISFHFCETKEYNQKGMQINQGYQQHKELINVLGSIL